jgi:molybdate transport system regulatory protein
MIGEAGVVGGRVMTELKLRILFDDAMLGPGKAALLGHIRDTGSISAAGRQMGMSYKRAWMLVEEMNTAFRDPLVSSARGGAGGGGAHLTPAGERVLALYGDVVATALAAARPKITLLEAMLKPGPGPGDMSGER